MSYDSSTIEEKYKRCQQAVELLKIQTNNDTKAREFDSCLQFFTNQIAQNVDYINTFEFFYCQIRENICTNMG